MISELPNVTTSVKNSKWCLPILNATQQMSKYKLRAKYNVLYNMDSQDGGDR